jgi:hypothetical protein
MMIGIMSAAIIMVVVMSMSSVPAWVDVVRSSFEGANPLSNLLKPSVPLAAHSRCEGDTGVSVVNLLTAKALIASHELDNAHVATSAVRCFFVVVVCHCCLPFQGVRRFSRLSIVASRF